MWPGFLILLAALLPLYLSTLQTIPNGAEHYYMIDVGETQIVLNTWGTLHATGYPLYVMSGNILVILLRTLGVPPETAPALVSLLWGLLALAIVFRLQSSFVSRQLSEASSQLSVLSSQLNTTKPKTENRKLITNNSELGTRNFTQHSVLSTQYFFLPALLATLLFGLTRTAWVHLVIAEIYSFGLLLLVLLLAVALWPRPIRGRIYWLALIGGVGVFHHRALLMAAPALLYAVWREIVVSRQSSVVSSQLNTKKPKIENRKLITNNLELGTRNSELSTQHSALSTQYSVLIRCLLLGLLGFLPYVYLPLRANAGAEWVYGQPNTWPGFWDQFFGREAERFIGAPGSLNALLANIGAVNAVLLTDLTAPGLVAGLAGLLLAPRQLAWPRAAIPLLISAMTAYGFHILLYTDILSALILPITLSVAFGWGFLLAAVSFQSSVFSRQWSVVGTRTIVSLRMMILLLSVLIFGVVLIARNQPFIRQLTSDTTGLETIALVDSAPPGSTVMLAWGPRYFAASFAQDVQGRLQDVELVDHRADYAAILSQGRQLLTPEYTFYNQPVSWWESRLGARVYLNAAAPQLVQIKTQPELAESPPDEGIIADEPAIECGLDAIVLRVAWVTASVPERDLSVFVHLLDADGNVVAQGDQAAPVYGWRPLTSWAAGERVRDVYRLPRREEAASVRFGLYIQAANGEFVNEVVYEVPVDCP
ncbi:MAG: DUF2723 domain-containing protein [Chloroflexi bacterium]|nr:DUF2723 domain-containing protein [Chloroflexota bacterium]